MSDPIHPTDVDHPLWSRFLRWCTIRPKRREIPSSRYLVIEAHGRSAWLESLKDYEHTPLPDPQSYIRLVTLFPGKFDDDVRVSIHHDALTPPSRGKRRRMALDEIRRDLPSGWEAFQTVSRGRNIRAPRLQPASPPTTHMRRRRLTQLPDY